MPKNQPGYNYQPAACSLQIQQYLMCAVERNTHKKDKQMLMTDNGLW
jgi:hypothetical protein